ncbi:phosphoserine phosphatase RsbU [Lysinibacillus alkalisoli]|uniref:Phosphoserine phosphatase RsbU n=1 Tax=Lysinibacillus alkalisoli TaxID=1911548 RepID=A0A917LHV5_9BACI|nr:PP2C family protein-serine/threonine phosphatase [Lysinibacillus alkalisoli]GGG24910.1 phosphoserine phosphatase RsbU [Lysinibacillus alkalisoli]
MEDLEREYHKILADYVKEQSERTLYIGQNFVRQLIRRNISPEDVVSLHKDAVETIYPAQFDELRLAYDFLIEMMVHYGMAMREHQSLLQKQAEIQMEMNIAANVQKTMLKTPIPSDMTIDIGMLSKPLKNVNGDYVHFIDDKKYISVAVTDVVGKGVPAALCMSMVKFGLESMEEYAHDPEHVLGVLNRIVERNVDDSMFISMFYGCYLREWGLFYYASAGHEPAFLYRAEENKFYDLEAKGMLLGIVPTTKYKRSEVLLEDGDIIVIVTDGVTEFRRDDTVDERQVVASLIHDVKGLPAQSICEYLYSELEEMQEFELKDDFSVVVIKKV